MTTLVGLLLALVIVVAGAAPVIAVPVGIPGPSMSSGCTTVDPAGEHDAGELQRSLVLGPALVPTCAYDSASRANERAADLSVSSANASATEGSGSSVTAGETCNSFTSGTEVLLADGTKVPIEDVKLGDTVTATDPVTGETGPHDVDALIRHYTDQNLVEVTVGAAGLLVGAETITATDHHPFYVTDNGGQWVNAGELHEGEHLRAADGSTRTITHLHKRSQHVRVYNLTINGVHTYYVGDDPILVHNSVSDLR